MISATDTTYSNATTTTAGLMSAEDKTKLDGLSPENIEPITLSDGYSYAENGSFKLGKMVCINCQIKSATALAANQQFRIGTLNYRSSKPLVSFAILSDGEWASTSQPCYLYIGAGAIFVNLGFPDIQDFISVSGKAGICLSEKFNHLLLRSLS